MVPAGASRSLAAALEATSWPHWAHHGNPATTCRPSRGCSGAYPDAHGSIPEFKGDVTLIPLSFPGPLKMNTIAVGEGKSEGTVTLEV